jgi:CheY-like chemotaxis protein
MLPPLVLVVDDHADTRSMLSFVIETNGYRVVEAADGENAIRLAESMLPNLILMDTNLPGVDGLMATERIRKLDSIGGVKIVFLSGHAEPQARVQALEAGADDYLVKPIDLGAFAVALKEYLTIPNSRTVSPTDQA